MEPRPTPSVGLTMRRGNLFETNCDTLVVTVNTVGVMGKGLALEARRRYRGLLPAYRRMCAAGDLVVGTPVLWRASARKDAGAGKVVLFPTKAHWRDPSRLSWIADGLRYLADHLVEWDIASIAVPPLGCGEGGLDWKDVFPLLTRVLDGVPARIDLYEPSFDRLASVDRDGT